MMACRFRALVFRHRIIGIFTLYEMFNVCDIVYALTRLPNMFLCTDFLFENHIGLVATELQCIRFT